MTENGTFRTSFSGFNKADVLHYIDTLQAHFAEETVRLQTEAENARQQAQQAAADTAAQLAEQQRLRELAEQRAASLSEETGRLQKLVDDHMATNRDLRARLEEANAAAAQGRDLAQRLQRAEAQAQQAVAARDQAVQQAVREQAEALHGQLRQVRADLEKAEQEAAEVGALRADNIRLSQEVATAREQVAAQGRRLEQLQADRDRYASLIGDVGSFIMEIRAMGQQFLETSYKRSESCLDALDDAVTSLEQQMTDTRSDMEQARQELQDHSMAAGLRLDELVQALEDTAAGTVTVKEATGAAPDTTFFR